MIQGYVPPYLAKDWKVPVQEGLVYRLSSVQVEPCNKRTQLVDAPVQIHATEKTWLHPLPNDCDHPHPIYKFTKFALLPTIPENQPCHKGKLPHTYFTTIVTCSSTVASSQLISANKKM